MSVVNLNAPCPAPHRDQRGEDCYPVDGACFVMTMRGLHDANGEPRGDVVSINPIGWGRDDRTETEIIDSTHQICSVVDGMSAELIFMDSIIAAHKAFPDAELPNGTIEEGVIAGYVKRTEAARLAKAWLDGIAASDRDVCDRCGGLGGASHWPGFTCFECNGAGSVGSAS